MAHKALKQKAIELRRKGYSYSQIKNAINVSKSTLHYWLCNMPLSQYRIRQLQAESPVRIERYQNTMRKKREQKFASAYAEISQKIGDLSSREFFLAGLFLYWAEGTKTQNGSVAMTNTNPAMLQFFIKWLALWGIPKEKMRIHLHLYSNMNISKEKRYWSHVLGISISQFYKPYIKQSSDSTITYRNGFGHGTCSIIVFNMDLIRKILMAIKYFEELSR